MRVTETWPPFLAGGGKMGGLIRAHDWAATPLGVPEAWPQVLQTLTGLLLSSTQPMFVVWGPERTTIYNDAYSDILAGKHPALGERFDVIWQEIWDRDLKPIVTRAYAGEALHMNDIPLILLRRGYPEQTHFSFSYTPVRDAAGVVQGFYCPCLETTDLMLEQRRAHLRTELIERLRAADDPADIAVDASALVARHLRADHASYDEFDAAGEHAVLRDFGPGFLADLEAGRSVAVSDVRDDPRTATPEARAALDTCGVRAFLIIPHIRSGRLAGFLSVQAAAPRYWHPGDVALAEDVAGHVTVGVERARAEAAQRVSEARLRKVLDIETVGVVFFDLVGGIHDANDAFLASIGHTRAELDAGEVRYENLTPPHWSWRDEQTIAELKATGKAGPYEKEYTRRDGSLFWILCADTMLDECRAAEFVIDITDRKRAEQRQGMLMAELDHRVKNVLALVQAIAQQSLGRGRDGGPGAADRFLGRLSALAGSHTLLATGRWEGARFSELVDTAVAPYRREEASRIRTGGPDLRVTPKAAQTLMLALHELVTNAAKHGALSSASGYVTIDWALRDDDRLEVAWAEHDGPPVAGPPTHKGFGTRLISQVLTYELSGEVSLDFAPDGLKAVVKLPLSRLRVKEEREIAATDRPRAPTSGRAGTLAGKRVLLVEDQFLIAEPMADALREAGYAVTGPLPTVSEALLAAVTEDLDAAVLDINLEDAFVWPAARALQARGIPFVFTTGYADTMRPPPELADTPWIEKPAPPQRITAVLAAFFARE